MNRFATRRQAALLSKTRSRCWLETNERVVQDLMIAQAVSRGAEKNSETG
jgi:hypothetical protein